MQNNSKLNTVLLVIMTILFAIGIWMLYQNREANLWRLYPVDTVPAEQTQTNNNLDGQTNKKFPEISNEVGGAVLPIFDLKFSYPANMIYRRNSWDPQKIGNADVYIMSQDFAIMSSDSFGRFTYDEPSFGYVAYSDKYDDSLGGGEGECPRRNTVKETLNLESGITVNYEHGGEISNCYGDETPGVVMSWSADPYYAVGTIKINGLYNAAHFSEISIINRNLPLENFKKIHRTIKMVEFTINENEETV